MKFTNLGDTDLSVSQVCLGSMTWGTQNSETEGHEQMDYARDHGVNFIDTAEMYPTNPLSPDHSGTTESIIGSWLKSRGKRDEVIVATKIIGEGSLIVRNGEPISRRTILQAIEGSLKRLQTDYVDLYQLHWPNRGSYHFRKSWRFDPITQDPQQTEDHMIEVLETLEDLIHQGKIRAIGLSNESCWGTARFLELSRRLNLPRMVTIQNEYNLLDRKFDLDLAELSHNENLGLLAFSPLAAGILSGKYQGDQTPRGSRRSFSSDLGGRYSEFVIPVVDRYLEVARANELDPSQMAIAFCLSRPFMSSAKVGATSIAQLSNAIAASDLQLDKKVLEDIFSVYRQYPNPMG